MRIYLESQDKLNLNYFKSLLAVALADGVLRDEEQAFFETRAAELGFEIQNFQDLLISIDHLKTPKSFHKIDEIDYITDIVAMAIIDGELHEKEYQLCLNLAQRKGFDSKEVDRIIKELNTIIKIQKGFNS
jgi:uncharacterized membrane protein YebE (DUF533 family)